LTESNRKWWVLVGVSIASFLGCIDFTIVNTALPAIQLALKVNVTELQWIVNAFILALSAFMVIMGRLADIYGRRLVLYIGMTVFGFSSLGAGFSPTIGWLIFFRLIQGISCAILYTASGAIVSNAFPTHERGKAIGTLFGINGIGLAIGPVLGGILVSAFSWRWIFLINGPTILISLIICFASVKESRNREQGIEIDWPGLVTLVILLSCFIVGITQGQTWGWHSTLIISLFVISIFALFVFYRIEMRSNSPIIQFHLFANRLFITSIVATFALALFYCLAFFLMPLYLHNIQNQNGYIIGFMLLPTTAMVAILSPIVGRITDTVGPKILLVFGFIFFMLSAFLQAQFTENSSIGYIIFTFLLIGTGWACILGPSTVASLSAVPENRGALAMGAAWTLHNIGGTLGLGIGIMIYHTFAKQNLISNLASKHINVNAWVNEAITNPDNAVKLFHQHTHLSTADILSLFHQFFITGYHAAMWLLLLTSFIALCIILIGMKK
jgi:EmrB/QacA subfamily drug resistance transporter